MIRINRELLNYVSNLYQSGTEGNITEQTFYPQQQIIQHGQRIFSVYVVKRGIAKCYLTEDTGNDFIQEFFGEGEIFGEIEAIKEDISFCAIDASSEVVVYKIPVTYFNELLLKDSNFNRLILRALANKINYKAIRHSYNQSHPVESNLLRLKANFPDFNKLIAKQEIANYLGITVRSLNRALNDLKAKGLVD